jgi:hypothetical protein
MKNFHIKDDTATMLRLSSDNNWFDDKRLKITKLTQAIHDLEPMAEIAKLDLSMTHYKEFHAWLLRQDSPKYLLLQGVMLREILKKKEARQSLIDDLKLVRTEEQMRNITEKLTETQPQRSIDELEDLRNQYKTLIQLVVEMRERETAMRKDDWFSTMEDRNDCSRIVTASRYRVSLDRFPP